VYVLCKKQNMSAEENVRLCLAEMRNVKCCPQDLSSFENSEERHYPCSYHGSFHKTLDHDPVTGHLKKPDDYLLMRNSVLLNDQPKLASVPLAPGATQKLVNPLASLASSLVGSKPCALDIRPPPSLSSQSGAAEMVELYCHSLQRDLPFSEYTPENLASTLGYLNVPEVRSSLQGAPQQFTPENVFRGNSVGVTQGPYVSQLALLDIPLNLDKNQQRYTQPVALSQITTPNGRVNWGVTPEETIKQHNGQVSLLPGQLELACQRQYLHCGRSLTEWIHQDPAYLISLNAAFILSALGVSRNPGFPTAPNQSPFITAGGDPNLQCSIGEVCRLALEHVWFWKWQHHRRCRPEPFGLWIHNVKTGLVDNSHYDISSVVLDSPVLQDVKTLNELQVPGAQSYTLSTAFKEGSPPHPAYPAGHAVIAGACLTLLKIFYKTSVPWLSLPGVKDGRLSSGIPGVVEADPSTDYTSLRQAYPPQAVASWTVTLQSTDQQSTSRPFTKNPNSGGDHDGCCCCCCGGGGDPEPEKLCTTHPAPCQPDIVGNFRYRILEWTPLVSSYVQVSQTALAPLDNASYVCVFNAPPNFSNLCLNRIAEGGLSNGSPVRFYFSAVAGTKYYLLVNSIDALPAGCEITISETHPATNVTVDGEINKLAENIAFGRNWAGIHYRSDGLDGLALGEKIAIEFMEDRLSASVERQLPSGQPPLIQFRRFQGALHTIKPTLSPAMKNQSQCCDYKNQSQCCDYKY
jgi:hypothetical protein